MKLKIMSTPSILMICWTSSKNILQAMHLSSFPLESFSKNNFCTDLKTLVSSLFSSRDIKLFIRFLNPLIATFLLSFKESLFWFVSFSKINGKLEIEKLFWFLIRLYANGSELTVRNIEKINNISIMLVESPISKIIANINN